MGEAARRWREQLESWAIPAHILSAVADSPWTQPTEVFARRADASIARPAGESWRRAAEALEPAGTVLDVGAGAGAASLALAPHLTGLIAVDTNPSMMDALARRADRLGVPLRSIHGRWPDVAGRTPSAEVVVCHHVAYNAPDLDAFAAALTDHARRRVVLELTPGHPLRALNPLWTMLHGITRPAGPTADDAVAVLRELGLDPQVRAWPRPARDPYPSFDALVTLTGTRLCLPPERRGELESALLELGVDPDDPRDLHPTPDHLVTLWWTPL
jgi:SAM-dependent methyltransferase